MGKWRLYAPLSEEDSAILKGDGEPADKSTAGADRQFPIFRPRVTRTFDIVAEHSNQEKRYLSLSPEPIPKVWTGFLMVAAIFMIEIYHSRTGFKSRLDLATYFLGFCGTIYWFFCLYKIHVVLKDITHGTYPISPTRILRFHLIPVFNLFWLFAWPYEFVAFLKRRDDIRVLPGWSMGLTLLMSLLFLRDYPSLSFALAYCVLLYVASKLRQEVRRTWNPNS